MFNIFGLLTHFYRLNVLHLAGSLKRKRKACWDLHDILPYLLLLTLLGVSLFGKKSIHTNKVCRAVLSFCDTRLTTTVPSGSLSMYTNTNKLKSSQRNAARFGLPHRHYNNNKTYSVTSMFH